ncbi:MAG: CopG family transcriptional regulator [Muribaculaceae bacterium]|nr:CopG family transcriptional regulator [Muribaculaceae bacterium]
MMEKHKLHVNVSWTEDNFCGSWDDGQDGVVLVTARTFPKFKDDMADSIRLHIQGCIDDGDTFPEYLISGDYEIEYDLDAAALIRNAETFTTMSVISRISGINQKQLSHYANGIKHPRPLQVAKIKAALAVIGAQLIALS